MKQKIELLIKELNERRRKADEAAKLSFDSDYFRYRNESESETIEEIIKLINKFLLDKS